MTMPKLLQLIRDNAGTHNTTAPAIRVEAGADITHIYVYDVIDQWFGASAAGLVQALATAGSSTVHLHINSPGGDVFESSAMASAIAAHPAPVIAMVDGMCVSAATRLALACSQVLMAETGLFMIHNSWTMAWGNKTDLRSSADLLDKVDTTIAADYIRKTGAPLAQVVEWMAAETWFTAAEAKDAGFVDQITTASQAPAKDAQASAAGRWNLSAYAHPPQLQAPPDPAAAAAAAIAAASAAAAITDQATRQLRLSRSRAALLQPASRAHPLSTRAARATGAAHFFSSQQIPKGSP